MKPRSAIKTDLLADQHHKQALNKLGDTLAEIEGCIDFATLAA
mgnify:CR=1 FL=1